MAGVQGRIALVTGASQGIGRAIAIGLAKAGATVVLAARNTEKLAAVKAEIEAAGGVAEAFALDVVNADGVKATVKEIVAKFGKIDILVNNAGITKDGLVLRMKLADWEDVIRTNLTSAFLVTQACSSPMVRERWGRIINVTSVVGEMGQAGQSNYAASKAGLVGLTKSLAREFASRGITVNAVAPGYIETAMTEVLTDEQKSANLAYVPLGRVGTDDEVAHAVLFLASEEAGYVTGHTLDVNGGMYMN